MDPLLPVALEPLHPRHAAALTALANDWSIAQHTSDGFPHPYTRAFADEFIQTCAAAEAAGAPTTRAIVAAGGGGGPARELLGCCGVFRRAGATADARGNLSVGYWVGAPHRGRGVATAALRATVADAFTRWPGVRRLEATAHAGNAASAAVLRAAGFTHEGTARGASQKRSSPAAAAGSDDVVVHDVHSYGLLREEWERIDARARAAPLPLHPAAAAGFTSRSAAAYERGRPEWSVPALEAALAATGVLDEPPGADGRFPGSGDVVEVGPGTGKSTRPLHAVLAARAAPGAAPRLVGVEPSDLAGGSRLELPGLRLVRAVAEDMRALPTGSARVVICLQAFHWFANAAALDEMHRVLAPGGHLVLGWNTRHAGGTAAMAALEAALDGAYAAHPLPTPRQTTGEWRAPVEAHAGFGALVHVVPPPPPTSGGGVGGHVGTADDVVAWALSISVVAALPPAERDAVVARVRAAVAMPDMPPGPAPGTHVVPLRTDFYVARRLP